MNFKKLITYFLFSLPLFISAQEKIYFDKKGHTVKSIEQADVYKIILHDSIADSLLIEKEYTLSGQIKAERRYYEKDQKGSKLKSKFNEGLSLFWYENGQIKKEINYKNNLFDGTIKTYWKNGQLKRNDLYQLNKLVEGICFDSLGKKVEYYPYEVMPQFPGGEKMLFSYLNKNVRYPAGAQQNKIQGRVVTQFVVDAEGEIVDLEVVKSVNWDLDAEALRVIIKMPNWIPGIQDGEKVRVKYTMPINFRLQ
jgi:protein TonB